MIRLAAYLSLACCALYAAGPRGRSERLAWICVAIAATVLALSLMLGLAGEVADFGRVAAQSEGWYEDRRPVQTVAIASLLTALAAGAVVILVLGDRIPHRWKFLLLLGLVLAGYITLHTISLHHLDAVLNREAGFGIRIGDWVELALVVAMIAVGFVSRGRPPGWPRADRPVRAS